jgi:YD repeat-containing protein
MTKMKRTFRPIECASLTLFLIVYAMPSSFGASADYHYDRDGRIRTALYSNGVCVVYDYDANGNRTSQTISQAGTPELSQWGSGAWGCFKWSPASP